MEILSVSLRLIDRHWDEHRAESWSQRVSQERKRCAHQAPPRSWSQDHRIRHYHYDEPHDIESAILDPPLRPLKSDPWCGYSGPGSAGDKAKGLGKGS
ncbi:unnamed protein product, partial [Pleuronectes platessa]